MSDKRIHDSLNLCFHGHRLIFWYDPSGEWKDSFGAYEHEGVEKIVVGENEFAPKVRILEGGGSGRFLLYFPVARPQDADNWLLDLLLQGHEFRADRASLAVQEVGLPYEYRALAEEHVEFFRDARLVQALKEMVTVTDEAADLRLKMMAVVVKTPVGMLVGWLLPACFGTWPSISQRLAWKSSSPMLKCMTSPHLSKLLKGCSIVLSVDGI